MKKSERRLFAACRRFGLRGLILPGLALALAGCTHTACLNQPLQTFSPGAGYRLANLAANTNSDELFVILAFSGGGTRAAALSYGVLEQLRKDQVRVQGSPRRLLDEVDVLSSVSGGSFTAAYFALFGDRIFTDFESRFLNKDIQGTLAWRLVAPWNWLRMMSPYFNRSDVAAEYYQEHLFEGASYSNLLARGKPFLVVNSTDLVRGARLEFTQTQFDFLSSDLLPFAVGRAVAASSAFPGALSPITLGNYAEGTNGYRRPLWLVNALKERNVNSRRLQHALTCASYLDKTNRPFIHLVDGGVSDNLGLRGPLWSLESSDWDWNLRNDIQNGKVKNVVVISVDARTDPAVPWNRIESQPNLVDVLLSSSTLPMANYSTETAVRLEEEFAKWQQDGRLVRDRQVQQPGAIHTTNYWSDAKFYPVYLCFNSITNDARRAEFNAIATSFSLPKEQVRQLRELGGELLRDNENYRRLLKDFAK